MIRTNCDYICLQPIYNKPQRDTLWEMEAAFLDKREFSELMDLVIVRELLDGNTAQAPKKKVRIMMCADFEDSADVTEKFFHWSPVPMDQLPPFKLCHPKYWEESANDTFESFDTDAAEGPSESLGAVKETLKKVF